MSSEEKISIEVACSSASYQGPSKYNQCLQNQLNELSKGIRRPNLSHLSSEEKISIEVACSSASYQGPSKYNQCLQNQLKQLGR